MTAKNVKIAGEIVYIIVRSAMLAAIVIVGRSGKRSQTIHCEDLVFVAAFKSQFQLLIA